MRIKSIITLCTVLALAGTFYLVSVHAEDEAPAEPAEKEEQEKKEEPAMTDHQKLSYSIGLEIGNSLKQLNPPVDLDALFKGINDKIKGNKELVTREEAMRLQQELMTRMRKKNMSPKDKETYEAGKRFLAANAKKEGVITTKSGLQYKVIKEGEGASPKISDTVSVHYKGTLIDGTEFDSSYRRGKPATFPVKGVIKGWTEALMLMKVGSKWELYIPSELAYAHQQRGQHIKPHSTLVFEVELLEIK